MIIDISIEGIGSVKTELRRGTYSGDRIALRLISVDDQTPFATLTVNLPEHNHLLGEGEFFIKTWSENASVISYLRKSDTVFINTERKVEIGHGVTAEIWAFANPEIIKEIPIL
jgi:hypothetical protein